MLSSPLQWPVLIAAVAGLVVVTLALGAAAHVRDARWLFRCSHIALRVSLISMLGLVIIDFIAIYAVGRTQMIGLRFAIGLFLWAVMVLLPVALLGRRARRRHGWLDSDHSAGSAKDTSGQ